MPNYLSCLRSSTTKATQQKPSHPDSALDTTLVTNPNVTTSIYRTDLAQATLTWFRTGLGGTTHIDLQFTHPSLDFHLLFKPFLFWRKQGSKKLKLNNSSKRVQVFWDLTKAKFLSTPEPQSGFYIAVVIDNEMALLVGDRESEAYVKTRARKKPDFKKIQDLVCRKEHVFGRELFEAKATFGGEIKDLSIDCCVIDDEFVLGFNFDGKKLLQVRRLEWKFRGVERVEVDGVRIHVTWDVYNWLFEEAIDGPAMFTFRFDKIGAYDHEEIGALWREISGLDEMNGLKKKKNNKSTLCETRSSSSSSISSSFSSGCNSSVLEWASSEESELQSGTTEFTLLVFAWKV